SLADLAPVPEDSLIALIGMVNADPRADKIDVGVGVFRDSAGNTPILKVMKEAEQRLLDTQKTKAYLGSAGDKRFAELLRPILLGPHADDDRIAGVQTPGGCGALRLAFELIATANPDARVLIGTPSWPNYAPIAQACGIEVVDYPYYERGQGIIRFDDMLAALRSAEPGDVALLHGCCHNPTGGALHGGQWRLTMAPPASVSSSTTPSSTGAGTASSTRCETGSMAFGRRSRPPIRGWPISAGNMACSRCCRCPAIRCFSCARNMGSTWPT